MMWVYIRMMDILFFSFLVYLAGTNLWVTMTWNCWLWYALHRNMQGEEVGLTACQFPGQWSRIRLDLVPLPAPGNLVSLWTGNIFLSLASSLRNCNSISPVNFAYSDLSLKSVWKHLREMGPISLCDKIIGRKK